MLDALEKNVRDSLQSLGDNVLYIPKMAMVNGWRISMVEVYESATAQNGSLAKYVRGVLWPGVATLVANFQGAVSFRKNSVPRNSVIAVTTTVRRDAYVRNRNGRYFSPYRLYGQECGFAGT